MMDTRGGILMPDRLQRVTPGPLTDADLPDRPTVQEIARWLRRNPKVIYRWAKTGLIPSRKVGRMYLFDKKALLEWAKPEGAV